MKDNWLKYLVALSAVLIAGSAAYFSVTGLGILFSGAAVAVMVMASSLEFAKLVSATYLKQKWTEIKGFNKWYLSFAVGILMLITSAGIFGYLSNAFQQQNLKLDQVQREVDVWNNKIKLTNDQIITLQGQQKDLSSTQNTLLSKGKVNSRLLRSADNRDKQSTKISNKINSLQDSIVVYNGKINDIKNTNIDIEREVGGFRFVADAFGIDLNTVVKFFIILIVIVFDPLAIALVIAFNQLIMLTKKDEREEVDVKEVVEESAKLKLSEEDLKKLEEVLLNPPPPNEKLKSAAEEYNRRGELLAEMMKNDQELGLYDEPFDNPMVKESNSSIKERVDAALDEANEEEFSIIEPTVEEEDENFSTIEPISENIFQDDDYLTEAIREFNQQSMEDEGWTPELEEQFWAEQPPYPFATPEELETIPTDVNNESEMGDEKKN
jgi:hypothetical protein